MYSALADTEAHDERWLVGWFERTYGDEDSCQPAGSHGWHLQVTYSGAVAEL